jgi:hypothetical protein
LGDFSRAKLDSLEHCISDYDATVSLIRQLLDSEFSVMQLGLTGFQLSDEFLIEKQNGRYKESLGAMSESCV